MNLSTLALILLCLQLFRTQDAQKAKQTLNLEDFLSDSTKDILQNVQKLSDKKCSQEDRMGAIFQMMSNPVIMEFAQKMFDKKPTSQEKEFTNEEGYHFKQPTASSKEFFRQIDNIADAEVKNKLYYFYENWYVS